MSEKKDVRARDTIPRGIKRQNYVGTGLFVGLRAADVFVQYGILGQGWGSSAIRKLGGHTLPQGFPTVTSTFLDRLQLSPYRLILLGMATGSAIKQSAHATAIMQEEMGPGLAVTVGAFNTVVNSINNLLFVCSATSASTNGERFPQTPLLVGATLYVLGMATETLSEIQRKKFKDDPANNGKVFTGGLFGLSRHVNYFGYVLWRAGYALSAGGWLWATFTAGFHGLDFVTRAIPALEQYCAERYGVQWQQYKHKVPYQLVPFVY